MHGTDEGEDGAEGIDTTVAGYTLYKDAIDTGADGDGGENSCRQEWVSVERLAVEVEDAAYIVNVRQVSQEGHEIGQLGVVRVIEP